MSLAAIVPVWNGRPLVEKLLASLAKQTLRADELVVVDNGSTDGAPEAARACGARVIGMGRNAGFAAAVNRGIRETRARMDRGAEQRCGTGAGLLRPPHCLEQSGSRPAGFWRRTIRRASTAHSTWCAAAARPGARGAGRRTGRRGDMRRRIWSAPWTAAVFRAALFEKTGLLEERFESYLEDVDFGLRCAALDLAGEYVPGAVAWHRGSAALGRWHPETVRRMARNQVWLLARHYSRPDLLHCAWPAMVAQLLWGLVAFRHGAGFAWCRGKCQGLRSFPEVRRDSACYHAELLERLRTNESLIRTMQAPGESDFYWRLYFLLTTREAK